MNLFSSLDNFTRSVAGLIPEWSVAALVRLGVFFVFWNSVQTKISGSSILGQKFKFWQVTDSTFMLFEYEYAVPLIPPNVAAYLATFCEFFLSIGVLLGLLTRMSAAGLLTITLVIQIFVYPNHWPEHLLWTSLLLYLIKYGPGSISVDALLLRR